MNCITHVRVSVADVRLSSLRDATGRDLAKLLAEFTNGLGNVVEVTSKFLDV